MNRLKTYFFERITGWAAGILAATAFASGCATIDDNIDDCFSLARLQFQYTHNIDGRDRFASEVETVDMFVYLKKDSTFVTTRQFNKAQITSPQGVSLEWLRMDDYICVFLGNLNQGHTVEEGDYDCQNYDSHLRNLRVKMLSSDDQGTMRHNPAHFFYGCADINKQDRDLSVVSMVKNTNDIVIHVADTTPGSQNTRAAGPREIEADITVPVENADGTFKSNGMLRHDNSIAAEDTRTMKHINSLSPGTGTDANKHTATIRVGRLFEGDKTVLTLTEKETGRVLATENLTESIIERLTSGEVESVTGMDPNEYLDREDEYEFYYEMRLVHNVIEVVEITVEDWIRIQQGGQGGILW